MEDAAPPEPRRFTGRKEAAETTPSSGDACSSSALVAGAQGGGGGGGGGVKRHVVVRQQVPDDILHDVNLNAALEVLPANYNFEVSGGWANPKRRHHPSGVAAAESTRGSRLACAAYAIARMPAAQRAPGSATGGGLQRDIIPTHAGRVHRCTRRCGASRRLGLSVWGCSFQRDC